MTYKLAKQLKEAGFPNSEKWNLSPADCNVNIFADNFPPTLEELIEACEKKIDFCLRNFNTGSNDNWICGDYMPYENDWIEYATGKTPTEAVAKLWLKLNENQTPKNR